MNAPPHPTPCVHLTTPIHLSKSSSGFISGRQVFRYSASPFLGTILYWIWVQIAPWHVEYFKLNKFEKMAKTGRSFLPDFLCPSSLKQIIKPTCEWYPPYTKNKGASFSLKPKELREESQQLGLTKFPSVYYTYLTFYNLSYVYLAAHSSSNLA